MADFTAKDVQALRQATGAGMMDAKKALTENDGDFDTAARWLREKGLAKSVERAGRDNTDGAVAIAVVGTAVALVEIKCETDFVAKSDLFTPAVAELAAQVAEQGESAVAAAADRIDDLKVTLKENIEVGRVVRFEVADGDVLDTYLHTQEGRGKVAVAVELAGGTPELAHDIALHIAFAKPRFLSRDEVDATAVADERETLTAITRGEGKPEQAIDKIVEGRLTAWFQTQVLLEQKFVKDEKQTISQALGGASIVRFALVAVGS